MTGAWLMIWSGAALFAAAAIGFRLGELFERARQAHEAKLPKPQPAMPHEARRPAPSYLDLEEVNDMDMDEKR